MEIILVASIALVLLVGATAFLFTKLNNITWYNVAIYVFLATFWTIMAFMKKTFPEDHAGVDKYIWPLVIGCYQITQVIVRFPLGKLSQKLKSRQMPIIIATASITISGVLVVATDFSLVSIIFAAIFTGVFGATFGMQNQYWSENYNIKSVFITVGIMALLPSFGALVATIIHKSVMEIDETKMSYVLTGAMIVLIIVSTLYVIFPERKETIRLDNIDQINVLMFNLKFKNIFALSIGVMLISFAFNLVTSGGSYQDSIDSGGGMVSLVLTIVAIVVALFTSLWLVQKMRLFSILFMAHIFMILGFVVGAIIYFIGNPPLYLKLIYLVIVTIGFNMLMNTMFGVVLHVDHKNRMLVLGIWLTFRSLATACSQITGQELEAYDPSVTKYLLIASIVLTTMSLTTLVYYLRKINKVVFDVIDTYEYEVRNSIFD